MIDPGQGDALDCAIKCDMRVGKNRRRAHPFLVSLWLDIFVPEGRLRCIAVNEDAKLHRLGEPLAGVLDGGECLHLDREAAVFEPQDGGTVEVRDVVDETAALRCG